MKSKDDLVDELAYWLPGLLFGVVCGVLGWLLGGLVVVVWLAVTASWAVRNLGRRLLT